MSALAKAAAAAAGAAGTGTWITVAGWPAVAAFGGALTVAVGLLWWVLAEDARTRRLRSLITALRLSRRWPGKRID